MFLEKYTGQLAHARASRTARGKLSNLDGYIATSTFFKKNVICSLSIFPKKITFLSMFHFKHESSSFFFEIPLQRDI